MGKDPQERSWPVPRAVAVTAPIPLRRQPEARRVLAWPLLKDRDPHRGAGAVTAPIPLRRQPEARRVLAWPLLKHRDPHRGAGAQESLTVSPVSPIHLEERSIRGP